jgi:hypothetical protein
MDGLMADKKSSTDEDIHREALKQFALAEDAESHNRTAGKDDIVFAREGKQWPGDVETQRKDEGRPCLTINKMPAFIRQVVNDARQNKPSIKVHPADSGADPETAEVINGLIRNIEYTSNADVAYDTATECAVGNGFGYLRVGLDYAYDDSFDQDITINRVANPFSVYGDPNSTAADSSDWDVAHVVDRLSTTAFKREYGAKALDAVQNWGDSDAWESASWFEGETVMVAEYWTREKVDRPIVMLSNGMVLDKDKFEADNEIQALVQAGALQVKGERIAKSCKVKQRFMSGAEILKEREWPGRYIPIIPVYGDEFDIAGKRYFRSLIHNAIDAQRMFNYWRTTATELVALAPRVPYIGRKGAFDHDIDRWNTANVKSHPFLEFDGAEMPSRQPLDSGVAAGALQEALNASDDMKAIIGLYDASLGARSNETSGRAIMARQREGDVSTFHFIDNMARAIRHTGRVIIDLIPHVYNTERIVRVIGEDGSQEAKQVNKQFPQTDPKTGQPVTNDGQPPAPDMHNIVMAIHDLTAGKYDLTVTTGPSFTTRREEAAFQMTEMIRALPASAPILGKHLAKNLDWPGADDIAEELDAMSAGPQIPPELQQAIEEGKQTIAKQGEEIQTLKQDQQNEQLKLAASAQQARDKLVSDEQIKREQIESDERIAEARIRSEQRLAALKDDGVEVDGPDGEKVVKTRADMGNEAIMSGLQMLGQMATQQSAALQNIATLIATPSELVVDPVTGRKQARKVMASVN